ncbi:pseudouridine synthase [Clostridium algidicarnis]|uniref:Pseudouridine synthase n=1 Tax=Clostridium algidicarnis TaxID=37659 RepID=A0ABS6C384_9CLOT|nr:pseudouridine synthase [Clostridium algidicarnis]MBU3219945.1 rRNA pseudouridine synthase [Clostridium algidicarnis]
MERLDKILSNLGYGSRKDIKSLIKKGNIMIDKEVVKDNSIQIDPNKSIIEINGQEIFYRKYIYLMMNKPKDVISATFDKYDETVIDLLEPDYIAFDPFTVGRLDKDTVGLILITNDGELNHKLISPKWNVEKVYYAKINKEVDEKDIKRFEEGIVIDDGYKCLPAKLKIISSSKEGSEIELTIQEGKFHQVKRMFEALDKAVTYLRRTKFGPILLDENLNEGEYRELSDEEIESLYSCAKK